MAKTQKELSYYEKNLLCASVGIHGGRDAFRTGKGE